jgi:hypothetical protein
VSGLALESLDASPSDDVCQIRVHVRVTRSLSVADVKPVTPKTRSM